MACELGNKPHNLEGKK